MLQEAAARGKRTDSLMWHWLHKFDNFLEKMLVALRHFESFIPFSHPNIVWKGLEKKSQTILDVGCGLGGPIKNINRRGRFYTVGVDIFLPYIKECKAKGNHNEGILCDIRKLPFSKKSFDTVICFEVLEHLDKEDGHELLSQIEDIARRQVIISTPVGTWRQKRVDHYTNPHQKHRAVWFPSELKARSYKVRGHMIRKLCDEQGLIAHLPKLLAIPIRLLVWVLAGPLVYFVPKLGADMICFKRTQ